MTPPTAPAGERQRRKLYGRRMGPKLSAQQARLLETLLPRLRLSLRPGADPRSYFPLPVSDVWLEIGFGAGEHLLWQAEHHPDIGLIGAEPYVSGVAKLLSKMVCGASGPPSVALRAPPPPLAGEESDDGAHSLSSPVYGGGAGEAGGGGDALSNIRIHDDDARNIIEALPDATLGRVFILFPDPWPKKRHHKRRFVQMELLDTLARVMKPGAELRFASDDGDYTNWTLERLMAHPAFEWTACRAQDWQSRPADWPQTRYEAKALHGVPVFLRAVRT
ncbi:MAG: tRNA (guanine(46)-N(7))-methyltransferase TrmB [Rhizomicrobium sp.]